jgi:hypothetical protein
VKNSRYRELLEKSRMDIAILMARTFETQRDLHGILGITDELWRETQSDEPPEMQLDVQGRVVKEQAS